MRGFTQDRLKIGYLVVEGINAFASSLYFSYLFFFMQSRFQYGNMENLALSASSGLIYMVAAWLGGKFAQRFGYFLALRLGVGTMALMLAWGAQVDHEAGQWLVMAMWSVGISLTWSSLEALVSEGEPIERLPRRIGIYNLVWAGSSALAYFIGGALLEQFGPRSLFLAPAALHAAQYGLIAFLGWAASARVQPLATSEPAPAPVLPVGGAPRERAQLFLRLAWIANPFAYVAINTVLAAIPGLAQRHGLSPMWAGFFCSLWFFARLAAFAWLWHWPRWHYRFRWFVAAYAMLLASFAAILLAPALWLILVAQVAFGWAVGLIYYSSLYYSMDVGETKGEHGGIHEAAIGAGIFGGPAIGAGALYLFPAQPAAGVWAVGGLLVLGGGLVLGVYRRARPGPPGLPTR